MQYTKQNIRGICEAYGFKITKSLGQNFLTDYNIIEKIIDGSGISEDDLVIEIGPGMGALTGELVKRAGKVIAIEIDKRLVEILKNNFALTENLEIVNEDILKADIGKIISESGYENVKIIGNLPYYITTPIMMKIFEEDIRCDSLTFMMQKEVAERISAEPGTRSCGSITYYIRYYCDAKVIAKAPKEAFYPAPKVDSVVLKLDRLKEPPVDVKEPKLLFECVKKGFGMRRKTLLNSLTGVNDSGREEIREALKRADIEETRRAETLSLAEFAKIANEITH